MQTRSSISDLRVEETRPRSRRIVSPHRSSPFQATQSVYSQPPNVLEGLKIGYQLLFSDGGTCISNQLLRVDLELVLK